jgi:hypothetical protein
MFAFRTYDEAQRLVDTVKRQSQQLMCDAVYTPELREYVGDEYPDAVVEQFDSRKEPYMSNILILRLSKRVRIEYEFWNSFRERWTFSVDGNDVEYGPEFYDVRRSIHEFVARLSPPTLQAFSWYWRKDWVAACVGV